MTSIEQAFSEAQTYIPGGVNSPVRAFKAVGGTPVFIERAKGAYLYDIEGKRYIDYVLSWGPMVLGHADSEVLHAVKEKLELGLSFGAPTEIETELAKLICDIMPNMDKIRFVSSGTEATMSAIRLARGFTGREKIIKFEGCYHGHSDSLLVKAGSGALTLGVPSSPGVPACLADLTLTLEYNNSEQIKEVFATQGDEIACVIVEPIAGNMNCIPPEPGFLECLREQCTKHGALLILDEVMTGFRTGLSGAQGYFGIEADLSTLGKIIGGGMPVGAFGGRQEVMDFIAPVGPVYQAGTLSGNPVAMAAGLATIKKIQQGDIFEDLFSKTARLALAIEESGRRHGVPLCTNHIGSMWGIFFTDSEKVSNYKQVMACDTDKFNRFFHGMLAEGVNLAPASYEASFMSTAHTEEDIDATINAADRVIQKLRD